MIKDLKQVKDSQNEEKPVEEKRYYTMVCWNCCKQTEFPETDIRELPADEHGIVREVVRCKYCRVDNYSGWRQLIQKRHNRK